jgi:ABC-2 type transport system permease protein
MVTCGFIFEVQYTNLKNDVEAIQKNNMERFSDPRYNTSERVNTDNIIFRSLKRRNIPVTQQYVEYSQKLHLLDLLSIKQNIVQEPSRLSFLTSTNKMIPNGFEMDYFEMSLPKLFSSYNNYSRPFVSLDWTNIILYLLSMIVLCFAYNAFTMEKQNETLKLLLANSVSRWEIITGKFLALLCILIAPVIIGLLINLILVQFSPSMVLTPEDYSKIILFLFSTILFIGINILIYFLVSILSSRSSVSALSCLSLWVILVIALPNTGWLLSSKISPVPSISDMNYLEEQLIDQQIDKNIKWKTDQWTREATPPQGVYDWISVCDQKVLIHNNIINDYQNAMFKQTNLSINISKISPFSMYRFLSERISDSNYYGYCRLQKQATEYQNAFRAFVISKDASDSESRHLIWKCPQRKNMFFFSRMTVEPSDIPYFKYSTPSLSTILYESKWDIITLILWYLVLFFVSFYAFVKCKIT